MRALLAVGAMVVVLANTPSLQAQTAPHLPMPNTPQSESTGPQDPRSTGSTTRSNEPLSERLNETGGVIRPREDVAPDIAIRPSDPGTTRVIPPPGTPGGDQTIRPK